MKRTAIARKTPLRRRIRVRAINWKRLARRRSVQFGPQSILARSLPCFTCGAPPPSDPSHLKTRGAGGLDSHVIPMCRRCHQELGSTGIHSFFVKRGLDREVLLQRTRAMVALGVR